MGDHREILSGGCSAHKCMVTLTGTSTLISRLQPRKLETTVPLVCFAVYNRRLLQVAHTCARESEIASCNRGCDSWSSDLCIQRFGFVSFFLNIIILIKYKLYYIQQNLDYPTRCDPKLGRIIKKSDIYI